MADLGELRDQMQAAGAWVFAGGLHDARTATVLRRTTATRAHHRRPVHRGQGALGGFTVVEAGPGRRPGWGRRLAALTDAADRGAAVPGAFG
jgi:hypothetical protein